MSSQVKCSRKTQPVVRKQLFVWENPGKIIDRDGHPVDTSGNVWALHHPSDNITINWSRLVTAPDIKDAIQSYVAHTIESSAPTTAYQVFKQLTYCLRRLPSFTGIVAITYESIEGAVAKARIELKDWHFGYIRRWYQWCDDHGIIGFDSAVTKRLTKLRIGSNPKGQRVMSSDIADGPLTYDEHFLLRQAVKMEKGRLKDRVIIMLLLETGARPTQLLRMEEQDFLVHSTATGPAFYSLNIPRAKQRQIGNAKKKKRRISANLGSSIQDLIKQNHLRYGDRGPRMPILCGRNVKLKKLTQELKGTYQLHQKVPVFFVHVRDYPEGVKLVSPRTVKTLKLNPTRLRYTYFTRLAEQGVSVNHLAELADHSNGRSVTVYTSSTSNVVDRLNLALGKDPHYSTTVARFLGKLIDRTGCSDPSAVILGSVPNLKSLGGIGVCGANFLCDLYPPLSCYVCPKFQAWTDAPHKELLRELETFVQSLVESSSHVTDRIPYQLVDVMASIRQLLERIEALKNDDKNCSM